MWPKKLAKVKRHNTFTDFTVRYKVAHKEGHRQDKKERHMYIQKQIFAVTIHMKIRVYKGYG